MRFHRAALAASLVSIGLATCSVGAEEPEDTTRAAAVAEAAVRASGGRRTFTFTVVAASRGVPLPDSLIIAGTDTVRLDGRRLVAGEAYVLDPRERTFRLLTDAPDTAGVEVTYRFLPGAVRTVFRRAFIDSLRPLPEEAGLAPVIAGVDAAPARAIGPDLRVDGSKTFGITAGSNRDPTLEQSLRLNVTGRIAGDVAIRAYLSDQNTPLRPEGDTEELRALDEVLVELESPRGKATLGDFVLVSERARLASVRRELSGAQVTGSVGPVTFQMAGARAEGEFRSVTFRGTEGKQGQYVLGSGGAVVAGSERVWVDGEQVRRGRDNDYVIDYDAGAIEFTETTPITSETEISVDYEEAGGDYARDIISVGVGLGKETARLGLTWFRESDDESAPSTFSMGESELAVLAAAGDNAGEAFDAGIDSVGVGLGDYDLVAPGVFEYAGQDSGAYDLSFERLDGGAYEYDYVGGYYEYVGEGEGSHRLGQTLPLPARHDVVALDGRAAFGNVGWAESEVALSAYDANVLSDVDDDDNLGNAATLGAGVESGPLEWLAGGRVAASLTGRRVGGQFQSPGRFREEGYSERWELEGLDLPTQEEMVRGQVEVVLPDGGRASVARAELGRGDDVSTDRTEFSASVRPFDGVSLKTSGRFVNVDVSGSVGDEHRVRRVLRAALKRLEGAFRPGVRYARDRRTSDGVGRRYDEYGASLDLGEGALTGAASYDHRITEMSDGDDWGRLSVTRTEELRIAWDRGRQLVAEAFARRRRTEFEEGVEEPGTRHDLVSARVAGRSHRGRLSGELRYTVTSTEVEEKERYVTEEDGVEITRVVSTGRYLPVTELEALAKWSIDGGAGRSGLPAPTVWGRLLSALSVRSDIKLRESTTTDDRWGLYRLDPDVIQGDETVEGDITSRHTVRYLASGGRTSVRLTFETRDELDRQYTNAPERRTERAGALDVKASTTAGITWRVVGEAGRRERTSDGAVESYAIDERSLLGEVSARRFGDIEARLSALVGTEDEQRLGVSVTRYEVTPGLTWRFRGRGALSAALTRSEVETGADELPTYLGGGRQPGGTTLWRLSGDYRVNTYLTATLGYTGERRSGSEAVQTVDLRVSAYF